MYMDALCQMVTMLASVLLLALGVEYLEARGFFKNFYRRFLERHRL